MKLRVLFLRKSQIIYSVLILAMLLILSYVLISERSSSTFNLLINDSKVIKADLTGDGIEDILYIKTENEKYYIQVNVGDKSFHLEPARKLGTVGNYYSNWPMRVNLIDINRDKIPEIFAQASQKNNPVQHIFMWNGTEFKDIYCSANNILGFMDTQSNRTPKFISGNLTNTKSNFAYHMYIGNNIQNFNYENDIIPGKDAVFSFIRYIESLPDGEVNKPKEVFYPGLTGKDLAVIGKIAGDNNTYLFQDATFFDTKANKNGESAEMKWTLNFKGVPRTSQGQPKNYLITLKLKPDLSCNDHCFKVYSIILN